ncbi:MAG: trehalose-6-phosphate synthase [Gemmatimonadetes bacterium SCN 70-22]|nr:MAG: trehalose-6-phosphate synthase [Gemmatimonadetes bacterium SCN 70-22]
MGPVRNALRLTIPPLLLIALIAVVGGVAVTRAARAWYTSELTQRARLAASSARLSIVEAEARGDRGQFDRLLRDIVRDDRVIGAALCGGEGEAIARSAAFPAEATACPRREAFDDDVRLQGALTKVISPEGATPALHVAWVPVRGGVDVPAGLSLVVVQDFSQVMERERLARTWGLGILVLAAGVASLLTALAARVASREWVRQLGRALRGEAERGRTPSPLLEDVRALAKRRAAIAAAESVATGRWTQERLRSAMVEHLDDGGLIIVANREPYIHERAADGAIVVKHPASGLVSALEPVMRACSGTWIAHGSGNADRAVSDQEGRLRVPPGEDSYTLRRVWLSEDEEEGYYYGLSNEGLWPLCHVAYARPVFRASDWAAYRRINERFADAVVEEAAVDDPIVLVQDYHFALAPRLIRERLPRATVITFWHIPFPNAERFGICPWREEIIDGLLGSSIVGFHTQAHCNQFLDAVDTFVESRIDRVDQAVILGGSRTLVRAYPISVEWPARAARSLPAAGACRREVFAELGLAPVAILGVGVDRLDYTKGLEERIEAVERLLERRPDLVGRFTFVQLAAPSRTRIPGYQQITDVVQEGVRRINARFGDARYQPVILLREHHEPDRVFRFYRAAQLCYVSSLHDGMNLVSKEFVSARDDEQGVLVLSQFAGAAHELTEALIVNPYDLEAASEALERAIEMSSAEQGERMRALRATVEERNVYRWAGRMLLDAAQLRQRARRSLQMAGEPLAGMA